MSGSIKWPHVDLLELPTIIPFPYTAATGEGNPPRAHPRLQWTLPLSTPNFLTRQRP